MNCNWPSTLLASDSRCPLYGIQFRLLEFCKVGDYRVSGLVQRPVAAGHDSQLTGYPIHRPSEAVRGGLQRARSLHPSEDRPDIQFSIAHEKEVIRIPGLNF